MGAPGRCVDDGDGNAVGEVVGGEAGGEPGGPGGRLADSPSLLRRARPRRPCFGWTGQGGRRGHRRRPGPRSAVMARNRPWLQCPGPRLTLLRLSGSRSRRMGQPPAGWPGSAPRATLIHLAPTSRTLMDLASARGEQADGAATAHWRAGSRETKEITMV